MIRNFDISDNIALNCGDRYFDLHNDFRFIGLVLDIPNDFLDLNWESRRESKALTLRYSGLLFFKVRQADPGYPSSERAVLNAVGFAWPDETEAMSSFIPNASDNSYHMIFEFMDGFAVRVFAETANLEARAG